MKEYEYVGVLFAIVAYSLIVYGELQLGFIIGFLGSWALAIYFLTIQSFSSVGLQLFFMCANIYGMVSLVTKV